MTELRFHKFNFYLIPIVLSTFLVLSQVFGIVYFFVFDVELDIYEFFIDIPQNLILLIFPILLICYNVVIIDEKGFKRIAVLFPLIRKNVKWNKIKYYAKVTEVYKKRGQVNKIKALWLIDKKGHLIFRLKNDYQYKSERVFGIINKMTDTKALSIEVDNPYAIRSGFKKLKNEKNISQ
ncbi:MAG: hypothetical protein CMC43_04680 [Flavobacteriaceae bacterium]|nr:hypothetical protein [Flavobacteriaceae bacterium]